MSRATMIDLPPEEEKADDIEPNEVDEIQQEQEAEQPPQEEPHRTREVPRQIARRSGTDAPRG